MTSPSGTSQETVAESALRCMTDTLTGAGGRSGRGTQRRDVFKSLKGFLINQIRKSRIISLLLILSPRSLWAKELLFVLKIHFNPDIDSLMILTVQQLVI